MTGNLAESGDPLCPPRPREAVFDSELDAWVFSRYADVLAALREPALWPVGARGKGNAAIPDEAAQQALRGRVLEAFSATKLDEWRARLERIADGWRFEAPVDLVTQVAEPWCAAAAEIITGADPADREALLGAARVVSEAAARPGDEDLDRRAEDSNAELEGYFRNAEMPMAAATFVAVSRTVACLLGSGWLGLLRHPEELARLRAAPELMPRAVEEILRYACLPQVVYRCALRAVTIHGIGIAGGERVILRVASANRDPERFVGADRIDLGVPRARQLSLGSGGHGCVGAAVVRMTVGVATGLFVGLLGDRAVCEPVAWRGGEGFRWVASVVVR